MLRNGARRSHEVSGPKPARKVSLQAPTNRGWKTPVPPEHADLKRSVNPHTTPAAW